MGAVFCALGENTNEQMSSEMGAQMTSQAPEEDLEEEDVKVDGFEDAVEEEHGQEEIVADVDFDKVQEESDEAILQQLNEQEGRGEADGGGDADTTGTPCTPTRSVQSTSSLQCTSSEPPASAAALASPLALAAAAAATQAAAAAMMTVEASLMTVEAAWPDAMECSKAVKMLQRVRAHPEGGADVLFIVHRSNNSNLVVYKGDPVKGVHVFWIMFEQEKLRGHAPTESLTTLERNTAYGVSVTPQGRGHWEMQISAIRDRTIDIHCRDGGGQAVYGGGSTSSTTSTTSTTSTSWRAETIIDGNKAVEMRAVHVQMAASFIPSVAYIEIFGQKAIVPAQDIVDDAGCGRGMDMRWYYEMKEQSKGSGEAAKAIWQQEGKRARTKAATMASDYINIFEREEQARFERRQQQELLDSVANIAAEDEEYAERALNRADDAIFTPAMQQASGSPRPTLNATLAARSPVSTPGGGADTGQEGAGVDLQVRVLSNSPRGYNFDCGHVDDWMLSMGVKSGGGTSGSSPRMHSRSRSSSSSSSNSAERQEGGWEGGGGGRAPIHHRGGGQWKEVRCNHPLPPFGISSPGRVHSLLIAYYTRHQVVCTVY
jgi:hypothetical protein